MESPLHEIAPDGLEVIETFGFTPKKGFARLGMHLDRAEATCARLQFPFDRGVALQSIGEAVADSPARIRMTVDATGQINVVATGLAEAPRLWRVRVADTRLNSDDPWLQVKTTERGLYNTTRSIISDGVDEVIFLNERDEACEGTITNIFVEKDGVLMTPPLACGLLPGVLRQELLETGGAVEAMLTLEDLKRGFYLGNSLRGLIEAELV
jgi:branched-subunit amino acid aminotransferase/4-amino-4-deoxychorismate lyase